MTQQNYGKVITFLKTPDQKASSELRLTNQTEKFLLFRVKSNAPELFTIAPSATGIVKPFSVTPIKVNISANADLSRSYRFLIQSIHLPVQDVDVAVDARDLWKKEVDKGQKVVHYSRLPVKVEQSQSQTEIDPISTFTMGDQSELKAIEKSSQPQQAAEQGDHVLKDDLEENLAKSKTTFPIVQIRPEIPKNVSTDIKVWLPSIALFVGYAFYYQMIPGF